jgi:hypothetical protein
MKTSYVYSISAVCGLILILTVSILYAAGAVGFRNFTILLLAGTLIWFAGILASSLTKRSLQNQGTTIK